MERKLWIIFVISMIAISMRIRCDDVNDEEVVDESSMESNIYYILPLDEDDGARRAGNKNISALSETTTAKTKKKNKNKKRKNSAFNDAVQVATLQGLNAMIDLYERKEPELLRKGEFLDSNHPAAKLSFFSASMTNDSYSDEKAAYANIFAAKKLQESTDYDFIGLGRQKDEVKKISLRRTPLEGLCPPRDSPQCVAATKRYRTHDGTCNNFRKPRWGSAHMPFHRFIPPEYSDGIEEVRQSILGGALPSARFVSLVVHGYRDEESQVTMMLPQWGQLIDHDLTATLQPRAINGSIPKCCNSQEPLHPSCLPMTVPRDDPFLATLGVRCLEFLRSAPAQRRDCFLSWREQTNQVTSFIDASCVYSSNPRTADTARIQRDGLLLFGRGPPREDPCLHGGFGHQCIRAGDARAGEQPGLLALHTVFVAEHNRITLELTDLNPHWSDEKLYQETRRIVGAIFQHITYREFLPLVLGREVCRLFDLELQSTGFYDGYDSSVNPSIANAFSAAAYRFGHSIVQSSLLRSDASFRFLSNNVTMHEENSHGDIGGSGSLHRIIRGMASQRTLKRDEFMSPELTNHLFQSGPFPFGMDLAAINIQRGRDHGIPPYVSWRVPCGLTPIETWSDLENIAGPNSASRIRKAYDSVDDIDLFVGGMSERPVRGGLVGPTFACIIAQQFSNLRKGDRFWYENHGFESSFTPAQLSSLRRVSLSQILCRSLGESSSFQPHAFLPSEFPGNERLRCGSGILSPINLTPWLERDPFHKEADFSSSNLIDPAVGLFLPDNDSPFSSSPSSTFNPFRPTPTGISNNLDFNEFITKPTTTKRTKKPPTSFNSNLDFSAELSTSTTTRPKRKRTTTKRQTFPTIIDNKIDFTSTTTTKRPFNSPFSKLGKKSNTTKRSTDKRPGLKIEHRSDTILALTETRSKQFRNEDNATKYEDNKAVTAKFDNDTIATEIESRINHNFYSGTHNDFDNDYRPMNNMFPQRPNDYFYPPLTSSIRPAAYENNRPNYRPDASQRPSPISNKLSGPFSYDPIGQNPSMTSSQNSYDNMAIPLYVSPNRRKPQTQYNFQTTKKADLTTFLIVQTTRRPTPSYFIEPVTKRPSNFPSSIYISSSSSLNTNSYANNNFLNKYSITKRPPYDYHDDHFDGYLRPDYNDNFYAPYKGQSSNYYDYNKYNFKPDTTTVPSVKYYFIKNRLHKYQNMKSKENDETPTDTFQDEHLKDIEDVEKLRTEDLQGRSKSNLFANTLIVPFRLLTRPDRPDNWINVEDTVTDNDNDKRLPDVPSLTQDEHFARELPKPFGSDILKNAHDN